MTVHQTQFERQAHHYAAVRARLMGEPKRVMLRVETAHIDRAPVKTSRLKATTRDQQNEFIKHRCQQLKVCCKTITAERLSPRVKTIRDQILMEVKERWPNAHARRLGELFNRKANSIRDVLASLKPKSPARPITPEAVETMRRLRSEGLSIAKIAKAVGVTPNAIRYHLGKRDEA
ncbi:hypothetical protein CN200_01490 [Sinorhizobium meliloti]|nr:hypothetical protein CN200_01490 [Sinorhizobium meliloti]RVN91472.1 hypothetical protein CN107_07680 [Sinorhizobium meliloti]RVO14986.1 hypothetical protein CN103_06010 [Sinorhizobium meliloti]